ncbi:MAG TPA: HAD-IB family hydrolase [Puia sp.]|nr:HAD-IB family hydrolase [Puia sp.]
MKRRIAFLDFDGTITTKDTLLEIIKFQKGFARFYLGLLIQAPILVAYKLKIISNHLAKQILLRFFFGGMSADAFQTRCDEFTIVVLPHLIRPKALIEIRKLLDSGAEVVVVSASAENWIKNWSNSLGLQLISTILEHRNGLITGRFEGKNCYGKEKVRRIQIAYDLSKYDEIYCYGDSGGDKPMMSLATVSFFKPFR